MADENIRELENLRRFVNEINNLRRIGQIAEFWRSAPFVHQDHCENALNRIAELETGLSERVTGDLNLRTERNSYRRAKSHYASLEKAITLRLREHQTLSEREGARINESVVVLEREARERLQNLEAANNNAANNANANANEAANEAANDEAN